MIGKALGSPTGQYMRRLFSIREEGKKKLYMHPKDVLKIYKTQKMLKLIKPRIFTRTGYIAEVVMQPMFQSIQLHDMYLFILFLMKRLISLGREIDDRAICFAWLPS